MTRPNVEVKFSNNVTFKIPFIKGEGHILAISLWQWLVVVGIGRGLGLGNCLVYDFR